MSRTTRSIAVAAIVAAVAVAFLPGTASAGEQNIINVTKVVTGEVPPGTTFVINVTCTGDGADVVDLTYDETGGTQQASVRGFQTDCTIVETEDGGAESVTYEASSADGTANAGSDNATIVFDDEGTTNNVGDVTVTNAFPEPEPEPEPPAAEVVEVGPTFTG